MIEQAYSAIARGYDRFNEEIDYDAWAAFCAAYFPKEGLILDLACGTGSMSLALARRGYEVIAADLSCDMLAIAQEKAAAAGYSILFLNQDMTKLDLYGTVDGAVCCLDSINYLLDEKDLLACLKGVSSFLNPGGAFVFDVNTPWKFEHVYGDKHYVLEEPDMLIAWQNQFDEKSGLCDFMLDVFLEEKNGLYRRQSEMHQERCYPSAVLCQAAKKAGLVVEGIYSDFSGTAYTEADERWYFVLRKKDTDA
ncbi:MAG: class I SAM-dependent methyltransferase [Clostridiales bacterium]|nr:class I SAM-dependent methyltransferase [Clostridiales bacterium]